MEAMQKLGEGRIHIRKMDLICGSRELEEMMPTLKSPRLDT